MVSPQWTACPLEFSRQGAKPQRNADRFVSHRRPQCGISRSLAAFSLRLCGLASLRENLGVLTSASLLTPSRVDHTSFPKTGSPFHSISSRPRLPATLLPHPEPEEPKICEYLTGLPPDARRPTPVNKSRPTATTLQIQLCTASALPLPAPSSALCILRLVAVYRHPMQSI
jgi:hypothetical protein